MTLSVASRGQSLPEGELLRLNESSHIAAWALAIGVSLLGLMFRVSLLSILMVLCGRLWG